MTDYLDEYICEVCGRRACMHKQNDLPPDPDSLANEKCATCHGTGRIFRWDIKANHGDWTVCNCMRKGYEKYIKNRIKLECSVCGRGGFCQHRPRTLDSYLSIYNQQW